MTAYNKALLTGSSGLVGSQCLEELLKDDFYTEVESWIRKPSGIKHPKLEEKIVDFDLIDSFPATDALHIYCCLGTTMKKAGSKEAFRKVDHEYVVKLAKLAERSSADKFIVISSIGANEKSRNFYLRTKGEMEESVKKCNIPAIGIFRPSMLLGKRKEFRFGELIGKFIMEFAGIFLLGPIQKYKGIRDIVVAKALISFAKQDSSGIFIIESNKIQEMGK